jgi:hypothetical protein
MWTRGVQLHGIRDLNLPALGSTSFTYTIADAGGNRRKLDDSVYTAAARIRATPASPRTVSPAPDKLAYTWSHEINDGQSFGQSTSNLFLSNNSNWLYNGNYEADRGNGNEDRR